MFSAKIVSLHGKLPNNIIRKSVVTSIQLYMRVTTNMAAGQFDNIIRK
jgi:hypothetical protein